MADPIGAVHFEATATTQQMRAELGKGRAEIQRFGDAMRSNLRGGAGRRGMDDTAQGAQRATSAVQGLNASITASAGLLRNFGAAALGPLGELGNNFASMSAGVGTLGVALITLTSVFLAVKTTMTAVRAESERMIEVIKRQGEVTDRLKKIREDDAKAAEKAREKETGKSSGILAREDEIERTRRAMAALESQIRRLKAEGAGDSFLGLDIAGQERALKLAEATLVRLADRLENLERSRTGLQERESEERVEQERKEAEKRLKTIQQFREGVLREIGALRLQRANIGDRLLGQDGASAAIGDVNRAEMLALREAQKEGRGADEMEVIRARFEEQRKLILAQLELARKERLEALDREARDIVARTSDLARGELDARLAPIRRARAAELAEAERLGIDKMAVIQKYQALEAEARAQHEKEMRERGRRDAEADARRKEAEAKRALEARERLAEALLSVEADIRFDLSQEYRSETDQRVAEAERQYAELIERAKQYGLDVVELERLVAERVAQIRRDAAREKFNEDLKEQIALVNDADQAVVAMARSVKEGLGSAFSDAVRGARSLKESLASVADDLADQILKFAFNSALAFGINQTTSGTTQSNLISALGLAGYASGGSFSVGGSGGTDSQLVAFKATPGERVDVSTPGQQRGKASVTVNVHTLPGTTAQVSERDGPDGPELELMIVEIAAGNLGRGGRLDRVMQERYGVRPRGRRG